MNTLQSIDCRRNASHVSAGRRRGFTLAEVMVVMVVIAILSALLLGALSQAQESARVARSRMLVDKLHNMLMARWDSYRTARLPIVAELKGSGALAEQFDASTDRTRYRANVARRRMFALRELMRMDIPDRYSDLMFKPCVLVQPTNENIPFRSTTALAYDRKMLAAKKANQKTAGMSKEEFLAYAANQNESAECLYMIITTAVDRNDVSLDHISASDYSDTDRDGMPEFRDAWGNAMGFLRWTPGFVSPMQPVYRYPTANDNDKRWKSFHASQPRDPDDPEYMVSRWNITVDKVLDRTASKANTTRSLVDRIFVVPQDDPFNPLRVGPKEDKVTDFNNWQRSTRWRPGDPPPENGYVIFPLIWSNGPDGRSGIEECKGYQFDSAPSSGNPGSFSKIDQSDPYAVYKDGNGNKAYRGASQGNGGEYDNIHNHRIENR